MTNATRIKIAALTTALALGGLTAAGLAMRGGDDPSPQASTAASETTAQKRLVVHRRKVKTVVAAPGAGNRIAGTAAVAARASAQAGPATLTVPETLGALRSEDEDEDEDDEERAEQEGEDEDDD